MFLHINEISNQLFNFSGVGTACIQLCKLFPNVKVIVTVGNEEKQKFCTSLGADLAINVKRQRKKCLYLYSFYLVQNG